MKPLGAAELVVIPVTAIVPGAPAQLAAKTRAASVPIRAVLDGPIRGKFLFASNIFRVLLKDAQRDSSMHECPGTAIRFLTHPSVLHQASPSMLDNPPPDHPVNPR